MRFWDASAVVPLLVRESRSPSIISLHEADADMAVWWMTRSECVSALARRRRDGEIPPLGHAYSRVVLHYLGGAWAEMQPTTRVRALAELFLDRYALKTADAFQLAAAFRWRGEQPRGQDFVCLDDQLRRAASGEGFDVLPH